MLNVPKSESDLPRKLAKESDVGSSEIVSHQLGFWTIDYRLSYVFVAVTI